jgi:hypothetical protein
MKKKALNFLNVAQLRQFSDFFIIVLVSIPCVVSLKKSYPEATMLNWIYFINILILKA